MPRLTSALLALTASTLIAAPDTAGAAARPTIAQIRAACAAGAPPATSLRGIRTVSSPGEPGDLAFVEAHSAFSRAVVRIYHEPQLRSAAHAKAACLAAMLDLVRERVPDPRLSIHWSALVLTTRSDYVPPRDKNEGRWLNVMRADRWDEPSLTFLIETIPHEQVHFSQKRPGAPALPRWFQEGHAEWVGLQVTALVRPDLARLRRQDLAQAAAAQPQARLGQWGGTKIKPEAIDRQISAEDRARRRIDPTYMPSGPMKFGPGDFYQDEVDLQARYGAALALFEGLERRHGRAAVRAWIDAVLASPDGKAVVPLCREMLGEDLASALA